MEKWLERILEDCKKESQKASDALGKQPVKISTSIEAGKESFGYEIDLTDALEKVILPAQLLMKGFEGIKNTITSLGIPLKTDFLIKGYSDSEYVVPYFLEDGNRQILIEPLIFSGFMEAFGMKNLDYSAFFPFFALDFFKYMDIMNAQTKPTIMAFIGLTGFRDITQVNFLDFIKSRLKEYGHDPEKDIKRTLVDKQLFGTMPQNVFKAYGIPRFELTVTDALKISTYDPSKPSQKERIVAYATSIGTFGFLNPTVVDYSLFTTYRSKRTQPESIGEIMRKGKALGHIPSNSPLLPDLQSIEALEHPLSLMKKLKGLGLLTEFRGTYKLTSKGLQIVNAEVIGKPTEWSLTKIWNVVKKAKDILPFLKFLSKD